MHLIFRPARLDDLPACLACTRDRFVFDPPHQQLLLDMWRDLVAAGTAGFWVMEDLEGPPGAQVAYFCVVAFVTDEFAARMRTTLPPYLALQMVKSWSAGASPFLDMDGLRRANTEGTLRLVCLQSGFHGDYETSPAGMEVRDKILDMVTLSGRGYGVQECFFDTYNHLQRDWAARAGFHVCNDHAAFYAGSGAEHSRSSGLACTR